MTTIEDLINILPDSYTRKKGDRWSHFFAKMAEYKNGNISYGPDILVNFGQCGPLSLVCYTGNDWESDVTVIITYKYAIQQQVSTNVNYELKYYGIWSKGSLPNADNGLLIDPEVGMYFYVTQDAVDAGINDNLSVTVSEGDYLIYDGTEWTSFELSWSNEKIYNKDVLVPLYKTYGEKTITVTVPKGTMPNTQIFVTSDYVHLVTDMQVTNAALGLHIDLRSAADNGARLLYPLLNEKIGNIVDYMIRGYFTNQDVCPNEDCDYNCPICGGYGFLGPGNNLFPADEIKGDYLLRKYADAKGVKYIDSLERYRWSVWSKYWWIEPTAEKIVEYIGHFTGIDPDRISITTANFPELKWIIRVPAKDDGVKNIIGDKDIDLRELVNDINIAGAVIDIRDIYIIYEGNYPTYNNTEIIPLRVAVWTSGTYTAKMTVDITSEFSSYTYMFYDDDGTTPKDVKVIIPGRRGNGVGDYTRNLEGIETTAKISASNTDELIFYKDWNFTDDTNSVSPWIEDGDMVFVIVPDQTIRHDIVHRGRLFIEYIGDNIGRSSSFNFPPTTTYKLCDIDSFTTNTITINGWGDYFIRYPDETNTYIGCVNILNGAIWTEYDITSVSIVSGNITITINGSGLTSPTKAKVYLNGYNTSTIDSDDIESFDDYAKKLIYNVCYYRT